MVPEAGIEPARYRYRWILSPVRLPVSPLGQRVNYITVMKKVETLIFMLFNHDFRQHRRWLMNQDQCARL